MIPEHFKPGWRPVIDTPEKARIYNRLLIAKIGGLFLVLFGLLTLAYEGDWKWALCVSIGALLFVIAKVKNWV